MSEVGRQKNIRDEITPPNSDASSLLERQITDEGGEKQEERSVG